MTGANDSMRIGSETPTINPRIWKMGLVQVSSQSSSTAKKRRYRHWWIEPTKRFPHETLIFAGSTTSTNPLGIIALSRVQLQLAMPVFSGGNCVFWSKQGYGAAERRCNHFSAPNFATRIASAPERSASAHSASARLHFQRPSSRGSQASTSGRQSTTVPEISAMPKSSGANADLRSRTLPCCSTAPRWRR